jgi:CRP-like cAMP-binding protein
LDFYRPGDFIALDSLFFAPPLDTVLALATVSYWALEHVALKRLMQDPSIAVQLMRHMAEEKQRLDTIAMLMGQLTARDRTAALLLILWRRLKPAPSVAATDENKECAMLPLTQKQLADYLGLNVIHLNRTLRNLRDSDVIHFRKGVLTIKNVARLEQIVGRYLDPYRGELPRTNVLPSHAMLPNAG